MAIVTPLARMRFVGKLCRLGAWIIAALGMVAIILFYLLSTNAFNGSGDGSGSGLSLSNLFTTLAFMSIMTMLVFFLALMLYAAGTLLTYMSTEKETQQKSQESDELVSIMSLPEM